MGKRVGRPSIPSSHPTKEPKYLPTPIYRHIAPPLLKIQFSGAGEKRERGGVGFRWGECEELERGIKFRGKAEGTRGRSKQSGAAWVPAARERPNGRGRAQAPSSPGSPSCDESRPPRCAVRAPGGRYRRPARSSPWATAAGPHDDD